MDLQQVATNRRAGIDRRALSMNNSERLGPGVYHYRGHTIASDTRGRWHVSEPVQLFHAGADNLKGAKALVDQRLRRAAEGDLDQEMMARANRTLARRKPQQVTQPSGRVTEETIQYVRATMAPFFERGGPRGKVKAYQDLALELDLGIETVARIARGDTYSDVR